MLAKEATTPACALTCLSQAVWKQHVDLSSVWGHRGVLNLVTVDLCAIPDFLCRPFFGVFSLPGNRFSCDRVSCM